MNAFLEDDFALSLQALQEQYDPGEGERTASNAAAAKGVKAARTEKLGDASLRAVPDGANGRPGGCSQSRTFCEQTIARQRGSEHEA